MNLEIEPASMKSSGKCTCCGKARRTVWGFVFKDGGPRACYFVEWTLGKRDCTARFDVVVGDWNDGTTEDDREAIAFIQHGRTFDLADAAGRPAAEIGRAKTAAEVRGTELALEAGAIAMAVLETDDRVADLGGATVRPS